MPLSPGDQLGPYQIVAAIGSGGMGEVYKASDTRLGRTVAIKTLNSSQGQRFQQEARAIAALNHPNICQLYDVGSSIDNVAYLVMELVEGAPLTGPLAADKALPLAQQIAAALEAAHAKGIVHRDLKPGNILVNGPALKLLDFGLARLVRPSDATPSDTDATQTADGTILGTPAYMSPEQATGLPADARSDIFSFGLVLYELLSGRRAFKAATALETLAAIVRDDAPSFNAAEPFATVIKRCLQKAPADRYQSATDLCAALALQIKAPERTPSIAILPFANMSGDKEQEYFSDGLAEEIINALVKVPGLKVIARTSAFAFKGQNTDIRKIAETLGVANILEGSVRRSGNRIRVTAQLITAADGSHLWSERYDREMADVFAIQDEISQAISESLQLKLITQPAKHTPNLAAYEAFLRGRQLREGFTPNAHARAIEYLKHAIALDPDYAAPHTELGLNYLLSACNTARPLREVVPLIRAEALRALALDPADKTPHFLLGSIAAAHDYNWTESANQFRQAMTAPSVSAEAHWMHASFALQPFGLYRQSTAELRLAVEQDPLNVGWLAILMSNLTWVGDFDGMFAEAIRALAVDQNFWVTHLTLGEAYLWLGRIEEAVAAGEKAHQGNPGHPMANGLLAAALVKSGDASRAAALIRKMGESPRPVWGRVAYHLACGEIDAAAHWFEIMIADRDPFAVVFCASPRVEPLRASPHWPKLARMMNLPEASA